MATSPHIDSRLSTALFNGLFIDTTEIGTTLGIEFMSALDDMNDAHAIGDKDAFNTAFRKARKLLKTVLQENATVARTLKSLEDGKYTDALAEYGLGKGKE